MRTLLAIFLFTSSFAYAQEVSVRVDVTDTSGFEISEVVLTCVNPAGTWSLEGDARGRIRGKAMLYPGDSVKFERFGYFSQWVVLDSTDLVKGRWQEVITLDRNPYELLEVVVDEKPIVEYTDPDRHVADFEVLDNGYLILTEESKYKDGAVLLEVDNEQGEIWRLHIPGKPEQLYRDFRGDIHLICEDTLYTVDRSIPGLLPSSLFEFRRTTMPVVDTIGSHYFFSNYSEVYPAFDYFDFDVSDSTYTVVGHVVDTFMMELYRAEYKWADVRDKLWAIHKEAATGVDKEIWIGAALFTQSPYYRSLYAPMFKVNDTMVVFDHYTDKLFKYLPVDGVVDSLPISHHSQKSTGKWERKLIQDESTEEVYTIYQDGGVTYLTRIDIATGKLHKAHKLGHDYPERIRLKGGRVYYIYRPFESVQKRYLYSENLGG